VDKTVFPRPCRACLRRWSARRDDTEAEYGLFRCVSSILTAERRAHCELRQNQGQGKIARRPACGETFGQFGSGNAMRFWLAHDKVASRGSPPATSLRRETGKLQSRPASSAREPIKGGARFLIATTTQGRLRSNAEFGSVAAQTGANGEVCEWPDVATSISRQRLYDLRSQSRLPD